MIKVVKPVSFSREQELANAIITQAAEDYRDALRMLKQNPSYKEALQMKSECEQFFGSDWYLMLTKVDPELIMMRIRKEVSEE